MPLDYLPIMAQSSAPEPPRILVSSSQPAWCPITRPVNQSRVALLTSAALRLTNQRPFLESEDLSYRLIPSDPAAGLIVIDHHSRIRTVPRQDPEMVFPRSALAALARRGVVGSLSPVHISFMGGLRCHKEVETELAPAIARKLKQTGVELALLVPY